ncbi:MAG: hypothetical protein AB1779_10415 [Candidatus Thermoplasmatota archaeon]
MKTALILKFLEKYAVFNTKAVSSILKKDSSYINLLLYRLKKSENIFEIERDKYTTHRDAFLISSRIVWPSYISIWSALRFYNLTEQIPHSVFIVTTRKRRKMEIEFANTKIYFILTKPKYFFGFKKIEFKGFDIFIAEPEKAVIDGMLFKKISLSEIFFILKNNIKTLSIDRLLSYAIKTKNKALIKRLGFLLDNLGFDYYNRLKKHVYYPYTPLEYNLPVGGRYNEKWRIVENVKV